MDTSPQTATSLDAPPNAQHNGEARSAESGSQRLCIAAACYVTDARAVEISSAYSLVNLSDELENHALP